MSSCSYETARRRGKVCSLCKGEGGIWMKVRKPNEGSEPVDPSYVPCPIRGCQNGIITGRCASNHNKEYCQGKECLGC